MKTEEKIQLVKLIESEIIYLTKKNKELKNFTEPVAPDNATGRISRMDAINNKSIFDASLRNAQNRLTQLQNILTPKADESFGIWTNCRQGIHFERLKIRPEIRLCATCLNK